MHARHMACDPAAEHQIRGRQDTSMQQATLTLHRQREMLMRMKIMQINALRGLLYEFGATFA